MFSFPKAKISDFSKEQFSWRLICRKQDLMVGILTALEVSYLLGLFKDRAV